MTDQQDLFSTITDSCLHYPQLTETQLLIIYTSAFNQTVLRHHRIYITTTMLLIANMSVFYFLDVTCIAIHAHPCLMYSFLLIRTGAVFCKANVHHQMCDVSSLSQMVGRSGGRLVGRSVGQEAGQSFDMTTLSAERSQGGTGTSRKDTSGRGQ